MKLFRCHSAACKSTGMVICRMILGLLLMTAATFASAQSVSPGDPNIQYFGRWDKSNANSYHSYWGGAYLKVRFTGTTLKINLAQTTTLLVNIDDTADRLLTNVNGTVNLTSVPLLAGTHTARIAAQFDEREIVFNGLVLDAGATTIAPQIPGNKTIEFIGDSITTGADNPYGDGDAYAWLASDVLGAEHTQISDPGITLLGMQSAYLRLKTPNYTSNNPNWNFSYTPHAIVINLGSNDHYSNQSPAVFQAHYIDFLADLRQLYPQSEIFVLRLFNGWFANETLNAVNARIASGDTKVHYVDTTGWLSGYGDPNAVDYVNKPGGSVHPSRVGHVKVARQLAPLLLPYLHLPFTQHRIEAEDLTLSNFAIEANATASFLNNIRVPASGTGSASYTFTGSGGTYDVQINYFDENDGASAFKFYVGSTLISSWTANRNLGSAGPDHASVVSRLITGVNIPNGSVLMVQGTFNGFEAARVDRIKLVSSSVTAEPVSYEAESGVAADGVTFDNDATGFMGTGFANFPSSGGTLTFNNINGNGGGSKDLAIRYANGGTSARTGLITINGATSNITFQPTGSWTMWQTMTVNIALNANSTNTIRLASTGQDLANIDQITVP